MRQIKLMFFLIMLLSLILMSSCGSTQKPIEGVSPEFSSAVLNVVNITTKELQNFDPKNDACVVGIGIYPFLREWKYKISNPKEQEIYDIIDDSSLYVIGKPTEIEKDTLDWELEKFKEHFFKIKNLL